MIWTAMLGAMAVAFILTVSVGPADASPPLVAKAKGAGYPAQNSFKLTPTPDVDLTAEYTRIRKTGKRPIGMAFGGPVAISTRSVPPPSR